jgi:hypothetical protein
MVVLSLNTVKAPIFSSRILPLYLQKTVKYIKHGRTAKQDIKEFL